jgi:F-type H+-transporting ATPase subunit delta
MMRIQRALEASTGKAVVLSQREDPALVAGVVTKIGSWIYDGSLRNQLRQLRETLRQAQ